MPVARFQLADGRVARFEVPEGTTPEQAMAAIEKELPNLSGPERSKGAELGRQIGLTARAGLQGIANVAALPATIYDAGADALASVAPKRLSDLIAGEGRGFRFNTPQAVSALLTRMGFPEPENATERVVQDITGSMAGQAPIVALGRALAASSGPVVSRIGDLIAARPGAQIVGAGGAGGGAGSARESGAGPVGQTVAGLIGGLVAPVAADVALQGTRAVGRGVAAAVKPFTQGGREEIVGATMRKAASDPARAVAELEAARELIPSSQPTTAQAARDPGLLTAERAIRSGQSGPQFAERASQQNKARNAVLNELAGDEGALAFAKAERGATADQLYAQAREVGIDASKLTPARRGEITKLLQRPAIQSAIKEARVLAANEGQKIGRPEGSITGLDYVKRALDDQIAAAQGNEQRILIDLKNRFLTTVDTLSPEYAAARKVFADMSAPVNQMEALQEVRGRVLNAGTDAVTGERIMSPAKFYNAVTKPEARAELAKVLKPEQLKTLDAIAADLDRGALSDTAGKAAGSNTYQNVSTAYVLGRALGGKTPDSPMLQNLMRPLAWLNKLNEPALQQLLTDAMLDPALGRTLMGKSSPRAMESISLELSQRARALGIGAATQQAAQGQSKER